MNVIDYNIGSTTGYDTPSLDPSSDGGRTRITVVYTTIEGTVAALDAAIRLSHGLNADITLLVAEEVPAYFPCIHAPVVEGFLGRVCAAIFSELGLQEGAVGLSISLCRRRSEYLRNELHPHSLVVLGERHKGWLRWERRLEHTLKALGHDALVVPASLDDLHARGVVRRLTESDAREALV